MWPKDREPVQNLIGKFVFLEIENPNREHSSYYDGEYLVLEQGEFTLHCIKPIAGYDGYEIKRFALEGEQKYKILRIKDNPEFLARLADGLDTFVRAGRGAIKPQWSSYVYDRAEANARKIREIIDEHYGNKKCENCACDPCDTFQPGDTVVLKSGGPVMTVSEATEENVECEWFEHLGYYAHDNGVHYGQIRNSSFAPRRLL